jgi:TRAP-type transport system periplasmic protein
MTLRSLYTVFGFLLAVAAGIAPVAVQAQAKIDLAIFHPERSAWTATIKWWTEEVAKQTQGRVNFVPAYAGSLVNLNETLKSVRDGAVPAGVISMAAVSGQIPAVSLLESIGNFNESSDKFLGALKALQPHLDAAFQKQNVVYLWSQGSTGLIVLCRDRHLKSPADWKGRKVRTAGRWQAEQVRALGASPVATDPAEQYLALQNRTIDCALSVSVLASAFKLHEVAPYITLTRQQNNLSAYLVNKGVWDKFSEADRAAIRKISAEADARSVAHLDTAFMEANKLMESQKGNLYRLTDAEVAEFRKTIDPVFAKIEAAGGEAGKQIFDTARKYW